MAPDRRICLQWFGAVLAASGIGPAWAQEQEQPRVSLMLPSLDNPIFAAYRDGGTEASKDLGSIAFSADVPPKPTKDEQIKLLTALINQKVAAIALKAVDGAALAPVCRRAIQRGIPVIAIETPLPPDARLLQVEPANLSLAGQTCLQMMAKSLHGKGRVAVLVPAGGADASALLAAMKREWVKPVYDSLKLAGTRMIGDSDADATAAAEGLLREHADLDGIVALSPAGLLGSAKVVAAASSKIRVTGLGLPSQMADFVKNGTAESFAFWNPVDLGYCATTLAGLAATGVLSAAPDTSVSVGRLGMLTIGAAMTVTMAPPTIFDRSNIERYAKTF